MKGSALPVAGLELGTLTRGLVIKLQLGTRIRNETVPIGHFYFRQRRRIHCLGRLNDLCLRQDVGRYTVHIVVAEGARRAERHRPLNIVEQCRRVRPITLDRFDRRLGR